MFDRFSRTDRVISVKPSSATERHSSPAGRPAGRAPTDASARVLQPSTSPAGAKIARANPSASNGWRSSSDSPTPTSFTGTPSWCWIARTIPPFAMPSSLVRTTPVSGAASLNSLRLADAVLPGRRVEHEQRLVRGVRVELAGDGRDLAKLLHEVLLGLQPAGRVDEDDVRTAGSARPRSRRT